MWLNATLNINPYFVDGIYGGDNYIYKFSNKKLNYTFTDNDIAYVHERKTRYILIFHVNLKMMILI